MFLKPCNVINKINLDLNDINVVKYLKGETIETTFDKNGWVLIMVNNFPLGWGKVQNGKVKNKYLTTWKWE